MYRTRSTLCYATFLVTLCAPRPACADALADALAAHKTTVDMVDTVHLKFEIVSEILGPNGRVSPQTTGQYWRASGIQCLQYTEPGLIQSVYTLSDRIIVTGQAVNPKTGQPLLTASITPNAGATFVSVAPWRDALFGMDSRRGMGAQALGDHVKEFLHGARYEVKGGLGIITSGNGAVMIRLDPKHNYLICGKTSQTAGVKVPGKASAVREVDVVVREFQQVSPGIYFPKRVVIEERLGGELQSRRSVTFTSVRVNAPVAPSVFVPVYKDGTLVTDFVKSTKYTVDTRGGMQGSETPLKEIVVGPRSPGRVDEPSMPTATEHRPLGWWLAPAGVAVILTGLAIIVWRRRRD